MSAFDQLSKASGAHLPLNQVEKIVPIQVDYGTKSTLQTRKPSHVPSPPR
jgi:hypothetical protein